MSRDVNDLLPQVRDKAKQLIDAAQQAGLALLVIQTYRTIDEQDDLYAQGRTKPGHVVTWAHGGQSWHNFRRAFDIVPLVPGCGKIWWNAPRTVWEEIGQLGKNCGLAWGGDWTHDKVDLDHFELTEGLTLAQAREIYEKTKGRMIL